MPTYEYECKSCHHRFEKFQPITAKPLRKCPKCGRVVIRLMGTGAGILFKGSGFYQTDYRSKNYQDSASKDKKDTKDTKDKKGTSKDSPAAGCGPSQCKTPDTCNP